MTLLVVLTCCGYSGQYYALSIMLLCSHVTVIGYYVCISLHNVTYLVEPFGLFIVSVKYTIYHIEECKEVSCVKLVA